MLLHLRADAWILFYKKIIMLKTVSLVFWVSLTLITLILIKKSIPSRINAKEMYLRVCYWIEIDSLKLEHIQESFSTDNQYLYSYSDRVQEQKRFTGSTLQKIRTWKRVRLQEGNEDKQFLQFRSKCILLYHGNRRTRTDRPRSLLRVHKDHQEVDA